MKWTTVVIGIIVLCVGVALGFTIRDVLIGGLQ